MSHHHHAVIMFTENRGACIREEHERKWHIRDKGNVWRLDFRVFLQDLNEDYRRRNLPSSAQDFQVGHHVNTMFVFQNMMQE